MFEALMPMECLVPIISIIATENGCTCLNHRFCCSNAFLLDRSARVFVVLLCLKKTPSVDLTAYLLLSDGSDRCNVGLLLRNMLLAYGVAFSIKWWCRCLMCTPLSIPTDTAVCCTTATRVTA